MTNYLSKKSKLAKILLTKGKEKFEGSNTSVNFFSENQLTDPHVAESNLLLSDLCLYSHAFVLACLMDRQMKAELVWKIPYLLKERIGDFTFQTLNTLTQEQIKEHMDNIEIRHRLSNEMPENIFYALQLINDKYDGIASKIWEGTPSSAEVVYRFLEFKGIGQKIATMATNILARDFKIPMSDHYSIDISVDTHVKRVFHRTGLVPDNSTNEQIIFRARAISPCYPGLLDLPAFELGQNWCKPSKPNCGECYLNDVCPKILN